MQELFDKIIKYMKFCYKWFLGLEELYQILIYCGIGYIIGILLLYIFIWKFSVANLRNYKINKWLMMLPLYRKVKNEYIGVSKFTKFIFCSIMFIAYLPLELVYVPIHFIIRVILYIITFGHFRKQKSEYKASDVFSIAESVENTSPNKIEGENDNNINDTSATYDSQQAQYTVNTEESLLQSDKATINEFDKLNVNQSTNTEEKTNDQIASTTPKKKVDIRKQILRKIGSVNQKLIEGGLYKTFKLNKSMTDKLNTIVTMIKENIVQSNSVKKSNSALSKFLLQSQISAKELHNTLSELQFVILNDKTKVKEL